MTIIQDLLLARLYGAFILYPRWMIRIELAAEGRLAPARLEDILEAARVSCAIIDHAKPLNLHQLTPVYGRIRIQADESQGRLNILHFAISDDRWALLAAVATPATSRYGLINLLQNAGQS